MTVSVQESPLKKASLYCEYQFNNTLWRSILKNTCHEIDKHQVGLDVISPWGFEVLEDLSFLRKKLKRFYCYLGVPKSAPLLNPNDLARDYLQALLKTLKGTDIHFYNQVVITIEHANLNKLRSLTYHCQSEDKLIDIQVRHVNNDILTDYADYIITTLDSIDSSQGEASQYRYNSITRHRLYQLYIMQEAIFGHLIPPFNKEEMQDYSSLINLIDNTVNVFYWPELAKKMLSSREEHLIESLILPRINKIKKAIISSTEENNIILRSKAYHIETPLCVTLDKFYYLSAVEKIKNSYLHFT